MRTLTTLALLGVSLLGVSPGADAKEKDKDKDKKSRANARVEAGDCVVGTAQADLDVNNVRARMYNTGNLFWRGGDPIYLVPKTGTTASIFASGVWMAGFVGDDLRIAAAQYENYEFYPGPLDDAGNPPDDCTVFDRLYKVTRGDISTFEAGLGLTADLRDWPVELGAPVIAVDNNGVDDDGDGIVDEGTNGLDDDGNGVIDNSSERERVDYDLAIAQGRNPYSLSDGDRPDLIGDQAVWWVMNDVGGPHPETGSDPIGVEIQAQAFAFARADALNNITFYKYRIEYKGEETLTDAYVTIFSDPDLGAEFADDYIGSSPELGVGFVYNADNEDVGGFGSPPPALGYDFFQGPIVDEDIPGVGDDMAPDTLGLTKFGYFNNASGTDTGTPEGAEEYYFTMIGRFRTGQPWSVGDDGTNPDGAPTDFIYPNTPGTYWSEPCSTPDCAEFVPPADRRFTQSTGPFTMEPGDVQEIVFGVVWAQGDENYNPDTQTNSVAAMLAADQLAQIAYDLNFELPASPDAPRVTGAASDEQIVITWEADITYDAQDPFLAGQIVDDSTYTFEGFEVYRFENPQDPNPQLIAVYDEVNFDSEGDPIGQIIDFAIDPATNLLNSFVAASGTNSGLRFYYVVQDELVNYQDYTYGVATYAVNDESVPKVLRSPIAQVTVRPTLLSNGSTQQTNPGDQTLLIRTNGGGAGQAIARVINPLAVISGDYRLEYFETEDGFLTYNVSRDGVLVFDGAEFVARVGRSPVQGEVLVEGISFGLVDPQDEPLPADIGTDDDPLADYAGDGAGIGESSNPDGDICPAGTDDPGCASYNVNTVFLTVEQDTLVVGADTTFFDTYASFSTDAEDQYFVLPGSEPAFNRFLNAAAPDDYEMRFTEACAADPCYAVYATNFNEDGTIAQVPFELWNIGAENGLGDSSDDYRMIPFLRKKGDASVSNFANAFTDTAPVVRRDGSEIGTTESVYFMVPDRENGYAAFEAAAIAFGGAGNIWDPANDGDDINPDEEECRNSDYYVDYCYKDAGTRVWTVGDLQIADVSGDGTTPSVGTVIRFLTVPNLDVRAGDVFTFSSAELAVLAGTEETKRASMDLVNVVPNPYRGRSVYERGGESRAARFINLPPRATIRIFTLSGNLIRTLETSGDTNIDWDLNTSTGLPVASGMYLVHVEGRDSSGNSVGEKIIKFGVVQREIRFNNF